MDNKFKIFVIVALIVLAVVAGTSTFMAISVMNKTSQQPQEGQTKEVDSKNLELVNLAEAITANILDEANNPHVVRIVVALEVDSKSKEYKKFNEAFAAQQIKIRDGIIAILRQQTYEMMIRQDAQEKLGDEIVTKVNELLNTTVVQNVYFGDFFVQ
ncbi:MAG: flagellar basal body-associated FliL family protein [Cellulosilyticaceae bacterium]